MGLERQVLGASAEAIAYVFGAATAAATVAATAAAATAAAAAAAAATAAVDDGADVRQAPAVEHAGAGAILGPVDQYISRRRMRSGQRGQRGERGM